MPVPKDILDALLVLPNPEPADYFRGAQAEELCLAENIVVFLRTRKQVLQKRNFESRPHHRFVLLICYDGSGSINVDGAAHRLQPGYAFLVKPFQFHFYLDVNKDCIAWLFITFNSPNPTAFDNFANLPIELTEKELTRANRIAKEFGRPNRRNDLMLLSTSYLLNQVRDRSRYQALHYNRPFISSGSGYELVEKINCALAEEPGEAISIHKIAGSVHMSESNLRKRFRKLTGLSLGSYLLHYKLNRAVKLLVHSKANLTQIALVCGYDSLAAFSRSFKAKLGLTPSGYRKQSLPQ